MIICCCYCCCVTLVVSDSVRPHRRQPTRLPIPGILQARTLEWVAISFSSAWKWKVKVKSLSCVRLLANPWTAAYQAPPSMGFSRQKYWSGVPLPSPMIISHLQTNKQKKAFFCIVLFVILRNYVSIILTINPRNDLLFNIIKKAISITAKISGHSPTIY